MKKKMTNFSKVDNYGEVSPIDCFKLKFLSAYAVLAMILSIFLNFPLVWILFPKKEINTPFNRLQFYLSLINLMGSLIEFPIVIITNYQCRYIQLTYMQYSQNNDLIIITYLSILKLLVIAISYY